MLEKIWRYKTWTILVCLTLVLQLSLPGWFLMTTAIVANTIASGNLDALTPTPPITDPLTFSNTTGDLSEQLPVISYQKKPHWSLITGHSPSGWLQTLAMDQSSTPCRYQSHRYYWIAAASVTICSVRG